VRSAIEEAEAASAAKTAFLTTISHEFRTPLNSILGYAQILGRDPSLAERHRDAIATIERSGRHMLTLVSDRLDIAQIEANRIDLATAPVDPAALLQNVAGIVRVKAEQKGLAFTCAEPTDLPRRVIADERRLSQILLNLLGNAIKFTPSGAIGLTVTVLARGADTCRLRFCVHDSGIGIPAAQQESIFAAFRQLGAPTIRADGTGLGLSISRRLARLMDSDIKVESRAGAGSRFWFDVELPVASETAAPAAPTRRVRGYRGPRRRILVASEDRVTREILTVMLESVGFETMAEAGDAAPDLAVVDCALDGVDATGAAHPELTALATLRHRWQNGSGAAVPAIVCSIRVDSASRRAALQAGAGGFLAKPIDLRELLHQISACLTIDWEYEESAPPRDEAAYLLPPAPAMRKLLDLARAGDMRAIREEAASLAAADPRHAPFAEHLVQLARTLQSQALLRLVADGMARLGDAP
jgi:CheY-like chemotaxis protein